MGAIPSEPRDAMLVHAAHRKSKTGSSSKRLPAESAWRLRKDRLHGQCLGNSRGRDSGIRPGTQKNSGMSAYYTVCEMRPPDQVRQYAFDHYITPTRAKSQRTVTIRVRDIHSALHFSRRAALVCSALGSLAFERQYGVTLQSRDGPSFGMSTSFTFKV